MMFPGSRSCINPVSRVVRLLTHIDDARAYIIPYLYRRFKPSTLAPTVGLSAHGFTIRWVQIFINDGGEFIIATVKLLGRFKFFINAAARARHQHRPRMQLIKSIRSNIKVGSRSRAGLQRLGRLPRSACPCQLPASRPRRLDVTVALVCTGRVR